MRDIRTLDLNLLKAFDALMDERSVTKAAARLAVTQPAMSGVLTRLRDNFDDPLFVRVQRGIVPTERALALAKPIKQILHDVSSLLQPAEFNPKQAEMKLSVGATDYALRAVILPFLTELKRRAPKIRVSIVPINDLETRAQLERGELDLALITPGMATPDLHIRHLYKEEYVCAMRKDHPAARQKRLSLEQFCALEHALVSYTGGSFSGVTDESLAELGYSRKVVISVKNFIIVPEILQNTDIISVLPKKLVENLPHLKLFAPPLDIPGFTKSLVWHERTHRDPAHKWIRELMFEVCGEQ